MRWLFSLCLLSLLVIVSCGARTALLDEDGFPDAATDAEDARDARPDVTFEAGCLSNGGAPGILCDEACVDPLRDLNHCGKCGSKCTLAEDCLEGICTPVAATFTGLRWELPCVQTRGTSCTTPGLTTRTARMGGERGKIYDVELQFRGVIETEGYTGGTNDGAFFQIGGNPINDTWNIYRLDVSSPRGTYYLNRGRGGLFYCFRIDYKKTIRIEAGATVTLTADPVDSAREQIVNRDERGQPIVVPGVAPAPRAFDGQFIQMDVVSVRSGN